jgi:Domain of unknown function (DUF397)
MGILTALASKAYGQAHGVTPSQVSGAVWRKSSFSNYNGSCIEVGRLQPDRIGIRDTKDNGSGPVLIFTDHEWSAFIMGAKDGQFDTI